MPPSLLWGANNAWSLVCKTPCYLAFPFDSPQQLHLQNGHPGAQRTQLPILIKLVAGPAGTRRQAFQALSSGNTALHPSLVAPTLTPVVRARKWGRCPQGGQRSLQPLLLCFVNLSMWEAPTGPGHLGKQAKKTQAITKGTAEPVRWLPKGPPHSSRAWNYAGQAGVASSNPEGADTTPHQPTHIPWCSALGLTSSPNAGSWSRESAGVAGSGKFGVPWGKTAHLCKGWKGREGKQAPGTAHWPGHRPPPWSTRAAAPSSPGRSSEVWDSQVGARARVCAKG